MFAGVDFMTREKGYSADALFAMHTTEEHRTTNDGFPSLMGIVSKFRYIGIFDVRFSINQRWPAQPICAALSLGVCDTNGEIREQSWVVSAEMSLETSNDIAYEREMTCPSKQNC